MAHFCHKCRNELEFIVKVGVKVGRLDTCGHCGADLHACKNCRFHDPSVHNECRIMDADFIRERDVANFCHQFEFADREAPPEVDDSADRARAKLADVFKKLK